MKTKVIACLLLLSMSIVACGSKTSENILETLEHLTFEQLDQKIENNDSFVAYFGWTENCGDSEQFQNGYLKEKIDTLDSFKNIYVVDLDKELPEALKDKEKRTPMSEKYEVSSSPTVIYYVDGKLQNKIEWSALNSSDKTGILESELDSFFTDIGLLK